MNLTDLLQYNFMVVLLPLILSNSLHMLIVKNNRLPGLARPIARSLFGANKTWRGIMVLFVATGFFSLLVNTLIKNGLSDRQALALGAILGITYALSELPNSWIKRRLGIAAGERPKRHKLLFALIDKTDSALGVALVTTLFLSLGYPNQPVWFSAFHPIMLILILCLENSLVHILFSGILKLVRIKKSF